MDTEKVLGCQGTGPERVRARPGDAGDLVPAGGVVCWLQRALRLGGNPALDLARALAGGQGRPLRVFLHLPWPPEGLARHPRFLLQGLRDLAEGLEHQGVEVLFEAGGDPVELLAERGRTQAFLLVTDLGFLPGQREELRRLEPLFPGPLRVVETETLVPFRQVSVKAEVAARTFRPRFWRALAARGGAEKVVVSVRSWGRGAVPVASAWRRLWDRLWEALGDADALEEAPRGGETAARACLERFLPQVAAYEQMRNQPGKEGTSRLSPYLNRGFLSVAEGVARVLEQPDTPGREAFLEQLLVRRELAFNHLWYAAEPLTYEGAVPAWARRTLAWHQGDPRPVLYLPGVLERAETSDPVWNACQRQLLRSGWMHNVMRMYWGKQVLLWMADPRDAFDWLLEANDRWALDGRDPSGYAGVGWCLGLHDRPWPERPVWGMVRSMGARGLARKADLKPYLERWGAKDRA